MGAAPDRAWIVVNSGERVIEAERGRPLLFALMRAGILIPSACGGHASCGQCRVRVSAGAPPPTAEERRFILPAEEVLAQIPTQTLLARRYSAEVVSIRDAARDLREIRLGLRAPEAIRFSAGQYVQLFLRGTEDDGEPIDRAYSISSPPSSGDAVAVNGPFGEFTIGAGDRDLVFIAGGSGMAPVRGMLLDLEERRDPRSAVFFYSARSAAELPSHEEMRSLEQRRPSVRFVPVHSRPGAGERWTGERGGIAAAVNRLLPSVDRHEAFLCGSPGMIDACVRVLTAKGLGMEHIHFDRFS
jgi:Na+-transporting NADH:ubiquinone oxidoreductase subunit F